MFQLYYWYVQSKVADALLVLDESGTIYYLSLGRWDSLVDLAKKDFGRKREYDLSPGKERFKNKMITRTITHVKQALDHPLKANLSCKGLKYKFVFGTALQKDVWTFLIERVGCGETSTYSEVAKQLGRPCIARQVGQACGANRIAVIVPCHRIVSVSGDLTGYRWGLNLKKYLLALEKHADQT